MSNDIENLLEAIETVEIRERLWEVLAYNTDLLTPSQESRVYTTDDADAIDDNIGRLIDEMDDDELLEFVDNIKDGLI